MLRRIVEVASHPVAQNERLAHIEYFAAIVQHLVAAGAFRQVRQFLHHLLWNIIA
jgi:hypothetical protein